MDGSRACSECGAEVPAGRLSCAACGALLASVEGRGAGGTPVPHLAEVPASVVPPPPPLPPIPGGYLSPSAVLGSIPVAASAPAAEMRASVRSGAPDPASGDRGRPEVSAAHPSRAPVLDLPFAIAPGVGPKLVAAGGTLAVIAFVLPWIPGGGVVIGGAFGGGYFATWGLAAIGNLPPFLLAGASLLLAVLPNRAPRDTVLGLVPVFLGGFLGGIAWTYLIAPFGIGIGIWALAGGAFLLLAGGTLVLHDRSAG